MEDFANPDE
jgi:hypothetical protein